MMQPTCSPSSPTLVLCRVLMSHFWSFKNISLGGIVLVTLLWSTTSDPEIFDRARFYGIISLHNSDTFWLCTAMDKMHKIAMVRFRFWFSGRLQIFRSQPRPDPWLRP